MAFQSDIYCRAAAAVTRVGVHSFGIINSFVFSEPFKSVLNSDDGGTRRIKLDEISLKICVYKL